MTSVLITGAGGVAVPWMIEHLQRLGYRVVAVDMDPFAAGLPVADAAFTIPAGTDPAFVPALRGICRTENVSIVLPLVDEELVAALALEQDGIAVITPRAAFVRMCLDKLTFAEQLRAAGLPAPATWLATDCASAVFPAILKPRTGRGSRGVVRVRDRQDLERAIDASAYADADLLVQQYIDGDEFTVSVVVWRDGHVAAVVPKHVIAKRGVTRLAVTRRHAAIDQLCRAIQERFRADGPFNVQLRLASNGTPIVFEINPRFSTTVSLTVAAGVDEVGGIVAAASGTALRPVDRWQDGLALVRSSVDRFVAEAALPRPAQPAVTA